MSEKKPVLKDQLRTHTFDGIQEYDNPMPAWWLMSFYACIIWAVFYIIGINVGWIDTYQQDLRASMDELSRIRSKAAAANPMPELSPAELLAAAENPKNLDIGKPVFVAKCGPCHGNEGQGLIGPNLTDNFWIHGGGIADINKTIHGGVAAKGMPAWGMVLKPDELMGVLAVVHSFKGTTPPNPKPPQGAEYKGEAVGEDGKAPAKDGAAPAKDDKAPAPAGDAPAKDGEKAVPAGDTPAPADGAAPAVPPPTGEAPANKDLAPADGAAKPAAGDTAPSGDKK